MRSDFDKAIVFVLWLVCYTWFVLDVGFSAGRHVERVEQRLDSGEWVWDRELREWVWTK